MTKRDSKTNDVLIMRLKSGEYDGTHIMKAWITIREQEKELKRKDKRIAELEQVNNRLKKPLEVGEKVVFTIEGLATHNVKQRAEAIRDAAEVFRILNGASISDLLGYANKIEGGNS